MGRKRQSQGSHGDVWRCYWERALAPNRSGRGRRVLEMFERGVLPGCATGTGLGPAGEWLMAKCLARGVKLNRRWGGGSGPVPESRLFSGPEEARAASQRPPLSGVGVRGPGWHASADSRQANPDRSQINRPASRVWIWASCRDCETATKGWSVDSTAR